MDARIKRNKPSILVLLTFLFDDKRGEKPSKLQKYPLGIKTEQFLRHFSRLNPIRFISGVQENSIARVSVRGSKLDSLLLKAIPVLPRSSPPMFSSLFPNTSPIFVYICLHKLHAVKDNKRPVQTFSSHHRHKRVCLRELWV